MTKKNWLRKSIVVILCLAICLSAVACSGKKQNESSKPVGTTGSGVMTYTVQVKAETGTPLEEIGVYIYTDASMSELVWFAKTDAAGKLTFDDVPSDNFVAVLSGVPAGYLVEEYYPLTGENTEITLTAGLMEADLSKVTYKLGDLMLDFSVTGPDGTVYKFSELLEEKDAVILNFWYLQCDPCKSEFPGLQAAYEQYGDKVALLAMNPVNQDNAEIEQFRKDNGYTFPMMACDPLWEKAMQITAYPTTVVVDRFGYISLVHWGTMEEETFAAAMDYFSAEDYEHTTFKNIDELEDAAGVVQTVGTEDNPVQLGSMPSFQVTVEPGQLMHYEIYRLANTLYLSLRNENAYIIYNGRTYYPTGGLITFPISAEDTNSTVRVVFGNSGTETQTYTVTLASERGSMGNPFGLSLGEFTANVPGGKDQGIFYSFSPDMDGVFTLELKSATEGVNYDISVTSIRNEIPVQKKLSEDSMENPETGNKMVAVNAYKGGRIDINIGTYDSSGGRPAANFELVAALVEGTLDDLVKATVKYSVNVTDETGNPVAGARVLLTVNGETKEVPGTNGWHATYQEAGTYEVTLEVPRGFTAKTTKFKLTEKIPSVSIKLDTIEKLTYTIQVTDSVTGAALSGAEVFFSDTNGEVLTSALTDEAGKVEITTSKDTYYVSVVKDGYISDDTILTPTEKDAAVALVEGTDENTREYTVNAVDYFGNPVSGMKITFSQNGSIKATANIVNGSATKRLLPGTYTVGVAGNYATPGATVTESQTTAQVTIIAGVSGETTVVNGENAPVLTLGATYVVPEAYSAENYYVFIPEASGRYQFTFLTSKLLISSTIIESYQGANLQFPMDQSNALNDPEQTVLGNYYNNSQNTFVVNIREKNLGAAYVLGLKQARDAVIVITRVGDAITDETDIEPDVYEPTDAIDWKSSFKAGTKFTYIDPLTQKAQDVKYVKGADGYYHLGDANGPILYVNLGQSAPYLKMSDAMGITDEDAVYLLIEVIRDSTGKAIARTSYNECLIKYVNARCSNTDVYPLTDDLLLIFQFASQDKGWADYENGKKDYLFKDSTTGERIPGADPELAWMYAVCYIAP